VAGRRWSSIANVVVSQLNTAMLMAGSFVVTPAVLYGLGDAGYGGWLLINSFMGYMKLLDLGASSGTVKFAAGAEGRGDATDLRRVLDTSSAIFTGIAAVALIATVALLGVLPRLYPNVAEGQSLTILMLGGAIAIDFAFRPFAATLRMRSLFYVYDSIEIGTYSVFKLGLVIWFAYRMALSYRVLALLTLGETIARIAFVVIAAVVVSPASRRINPLRADRTMVRKLATMGFAVSVIMVADIFRFQVDAGVIGYFLPESPESISVFGVGTRLASIAYTAIGVIGAVLLPRFSGLAETGDRAGMVALLKKANLVTGLVSSLVFVNLAVMGPHFLALWLKKPWIASSGKILLIVLPAYYVALLTGPSAGLLTGGGKLRGMMVLTVVEAFVNFALSVVLVHSLGIYGVAIGTAIPLAFFRGIVFPILLEKEMGVGAMDYVKTHAPAVALGVVYLLFALPLAWVPLVSYGRFVGLCVGSVALFAALVMVFVPDARATVRKRLRRRPQAAAPPSP
jgi:O-antigen/teichoic acid export membrane protein